MRKFPIAAVVVSAVLITACGSPAPVPHTTAITMPAGCSAALRSLPSGVPATGAEAGADVGRIGGVKGTVVDSMRDKVAADLLTLSFDLSEGGAATAAVRAFQRDAQALRAYCS